jgi:hypothetical protein
METVKWTYKALETLSTDWDAIETMEYNEVFLIPYAINEGGPTPFLEFGLIKSFLQKEDSKRDTLSFVSLFGRNYEEILTWGKNKMNFLLDGKISFENVTERERLFSGTEEYEFRGFLLFEENLYVFVDVSKWKRNDIMCMGKNSPLWFVLVDEIKNSKHTCLLEWYHHVEHFFSFHPEFSWLHNEEGQQYESPEVVYIPSPGNKLKFVAIFGPQSEESSFRDYYEAFEEGNKRYHEEEGWWGLVRFASFSESESKSEKKLEGLSFHYVDKKRVKEDSYHYIM